MSSPCVSDGDRLTIEGLRSTLIYTPGHTDDSYSFVLPDRVFTGDTLLIRGTGRTDFQNGDARAAVRLDLQPPAASFPTTRLSIPAHDYKGDTVSTIGEEKAFNPRLQVKSVDEYVDAHEQSQACQPEDDGRRGSGQYEGRACRRRRLRIAAGRSRAAQALALVGKPDIALIDLREQSERESHGTIPGSLHVPYPALQENISDGGMLHELAKVDRQALLFYCAFGERSAMAVQAAQDAGLDIGLPYPGRHRRLEENVRPAQSLKSPRDVRAGFLHEKSIRRRRISGPFFFGLPPP